MPDIQRIRKGRPAATHGTWAVPLAAMAAVAVAGGIGCATAATSAYGAEELAFADAEDAGYVLPAIHARRTDGRGGEGPDQDRPAHPRGSHGGYGHHPRRDRRLWLADPGRRAPQPGRFRAFAGLRADHRLFARAVRKLEQQPPAPAGGRRAGQQRQQRHRLHLGYGPVVHGAIHGDRPRTRLGPVRIQRHQRRHRHQHPQALGGYGNCRRRRVSGTPERATWSCPEARPIPGSVSSPGSNTRRPRATSTIPTTPPAARGRTAVSASSRSTTPTVPIPAT